MFGKVLHITCGGWRRPHSYYLGHLPEMMNCFSFVKVYLEFLILCYLIITFRSLRLSLLVYLLLDMKSCCLTLDRMISYIFIDTGSLKIIGKYTPRISICNFMGGRYIHCVSSLENHYVLEMRITNWLLSLVGLLLVVKMEQCD